MFIRNLFLNQAALTASLILCSGTAVITNAADPTMLFQTQLKTGNEIIKNFESNRIKLDGKWEVKLPGDSKTYTAKLPGSLDESRIGEPLKEAEYGALSRIVRYIGAATYTREIEIPKNMSGMELEVFLERVMWQSKIKVDGKEIDGVQESLATPHVHKLGKLSSGKHKLEITIDNSMIYRLGGKGHAYSESMQTIWNGVIGILEIRPVNPISEVRIDAEYPADKLVVSFKGPEGPYALQLIPKNPNHKENFSSIFNVVPTVNDKKVITYTFTAEKPFAWSEFNPNLYTLNVVCLAPTPSPAVITSDVGFRTLKREGNKLFINGNPLFLRGNLDNCHFPLTGYPSPYKADWLKIFKISKDNGLNNIRFHSYCPPKAAFEAADELGLYLAPETDLWIDGWMPGDEKGKPFIGLGKGDESLDSFIRSEMRAIVDAYGNMPSMTMMALGNELGSSNFKAMGDWIQEIKNDDVRRLYSASTARQITNADDYNVTHNYPGIGGLRQQMNSHTNWNYESQFKKTAVPALAHEIGQWPVYPNFEEIDQYTGVLRARNLEEFREKAEKANVLRFNKNYSYASGMQNKMMYKDEIESFLRTPSCRGLHLLGIQDYSGQGEALIGWLNSFYEEKGALKAEEVRTFFAPTVVLSRFPKYGWRQNETYSADVLIHHYGKKPLDSGKVVCKLENAEGKIIFQKELPTSQYPIGSIVTVGKVEIPLAGIEPGRCTFRTQLFSNDQAVSGENQWPMWIFPTEIKNDIPENVVLTDNAATAVEAMKNGKNVVLDASEVNLKGKTVLGAWGAVYWSTTWFKGQSWKTLGLWLDDKSPVFKGFNPQGFGDWIWRTIAGGGKAFILNDMSSHYTPIAMPVPDFHHNQLLGTIFEIKVGDGKLLVCGYNLKRNIPEVEQLRRNLIDYAAGSSFNPTAEKTPQWVLETFHLPKHGFLPRPEKYKDAKIYIESSNKLKTQNKEIAWDIKNDRAELAEGTKLNAQNVVQWRDNDGEFWVMRKGSKVTLSFPSGETGRLYVRFCDPNKNNRSGKGIFEGREFTIPNHQTNPNGEFWLELDVDREDSLDGKLEFTAEPTSGPNLMIDRFIYMTHQK